jgi:hypothetical protein
VAKSEELIRVQLRREESHGGSCRVVSHHMNVLVNADRNVKAGDRITLVDSDAPEEQWQVVQIHETIRRVDIKHGWNNNI